MRGRTLAGAGGLAAALAVALVLVNGGPAALGPILDVDLDRLGPAPAAAQPERYMVQDAFPGVTFDTPVCVAAPRDGSDRVFVVERPGRIRVGKKFRGGSPVAPPTTFLDISNLMTRPPLDEGQGGLLTLAFPPDYARSGEFYVFYGTGSGTDADPFRSVVAAYRANASLPDVANPASARVVLTVPRAVKIHFGGGLAFDADGMLLVGIGDSGLKDDPERVAQDTRRLDAKILRIDPRPTGGRPYGIPRDNPWADGRGGVRPEIFAYGVRNPYRISVDRTTRTVWLGDLGQKKREEVSVVPRGGNLGWPLMEADLVNVPGSDPTQYVRPVYAYGRELGSSVIGGLVYRGQRCPGLVGKYLFADNSAVWPSNDTKAGRAWALPVADGRSTGAPEAVAEVEDVVSVDEDAQGEVYFSMLGTGRVTTLVPAP
jgi:glucose/arabinose dehydrogenase